MTGDCWTQEDYNYVIKRVKDHLWIYLRENATIEELKNAVQNLTWLDEKDLDYLAIVHFLLSDQVKEFVLAVSSIFRRISHSSQREVIINKGCVRGRINWNRTFKERCSQGYDPSIFVCSPPARIYNLPENQLLKYILVKIKSLIEKTAALPRIEEKNVKLDELRTEDGKEKWTDRIAWIKFHVNNALKHAYLRGVDVPDKVSSRMLRRAKSARNKDYEKAAASYSLHDLIIRKANREILKELVEEKVLGPLERDTLYELYVLFEIMNSLGKPIELNLVKPRAQSIGAFRFGEDTVRVYFQRVRGLLEESKYTEIFENYDLGASLRRPDIILHFEGKDKFLIIEVKRTTDKKYIADSVYKVLGYLADFGKIFSEEQKPKGVLVVWNIKQIAKKEQDISILAHDEITEFVKELKH